MRVAKVFGLIVCLLLILTGSAPAEDREREKVTDPVLARFIEDAKAYVELRQKIEKDLPQLKDKEDANEINAHQQTLRLKLAAARNGSRRGDLFTPDVASALKRIINADLRGPAGKMARKTVGESSPQNVECQVNSAYPSTEPVSTVPPDLLRKLPELPDNLEYRFSKRDLILRDAKANMIVDCLPNAISTVNRPTENKTE